MHKEPEPQIINVHSFYKNLQTFGQRLADKIATTMGSWKFIIIQSLILTLWMIANSIHGIQHWDIYPFILMNLVLSTQAAYAAPIIMMSQNRQEAKDRLRSENDYAVDKHSAEMVDRIDDKIDKIIAYLKISE